MVFKARLSLHTFPSAVRSAVRSHNVKLVGLFEIISSRGDFQARDNSIGSETQHSIKTKVDIHEFTFYSLSWLRVNTPPRNGSHVESRA